MAPNSIEKLFNTAPDEMSDSDAERIVDFFRAKRKEMLGAPAKAAAAKPKKIAADLNLKLDDLDIKI